MYFNLKVEFISAPQDPGIYNPSLWYFNQFTFHPYWAFQVSYFCQTFLVFNHNTASMLSPIWSVSSSHIWPHVAQTRQIAPTFCFFNFLEEAQLNYLLFQHSWRFCIKCNNLGCCIDERSDAMHACMPVICTVCISPAGEKLKVPYDGGSGRYHSHVFWGLHSL